MLAFAFGGQPQIPYSQVCPAAIHNLKIKGAIIQTVGKTYDTLITLIFCQNIGMSRIHRQETTVFT